MSSTRNDRIRLECMKANTAGWPAEAASAAYRIAQRINQLSEKYNDFVMHGTEKRITLGEVIELRDLEKELCSMQEEFMVTPQLEPEIIMSQSRNRWKGKYTKGTG